MHTWNQTMPNNCFYSPPKMLFKIGDKLVLKANSTGEHHLIVMMTRGGFYQLLYSDKSRNDMSANHDVKIMEKAFKVIK